MEKQEKILIQLKFGLVLKKILDENKIQAENNKSTGVVDRNLITSLGKLDTASGITKAMLVAIINGNKNAALTTIVVILEALGLSFVKFGQYYDAITEQEVKDYKGRIEVNKKTRISAAKKRGVVKKRKPKG